LDFRAATFFDLGAGASFVFDILLSLQNLHFYFTASKSACAWIDCDVGVLRDTPENFDCVEKGFGLTKSEERNYHRGHREGGEEGTEKERGGVKPPLRGSRPFSGYGDGGA
jgi:hypothetical protein